jgi:hypothetical protein
MENYHLLHGEGEPVSQINLSDGSDVVVVEDCLEERPTERIAYDVRHGVDGTPTVYMIHDSIVYLHFAGRLLTKADVQQIEAWSSASTILSYTGRDGVADGGWRMHADPPAKINRKDGDSLDWMIDARLWRLS